MLPLSQASPDAMHDYYARRAAEYEQVYDKPERQADLSAIKAWLPAQFTGRRVLELACGTCYWTPIAGRDAAHWLATDLGEEVLNIARGKLLPRERFAFARADAYRPPQSAEAPFDAAFCGFWWSHVPRQRLDGWLAALHAVLAPGARVVFLDNRYVEGSSTPISHRDEAGNSYQTRRLGDGSVHEVLKNFPEEPELRARLGRRADDLRWQSWQHYWASCYTLN